MREEDLVRIEQGDPTPISEIILGIGFFIGIVALIVFIIVLSL